MLMHDMITGVDLVATAVFAISGALAAAEEKHDILGFILFGTITGIGGGTVRDLLLGAYEVFWYADTRYLWICIAAAIATWFLAPLFHSLHKVLLWADAVGMALFSVLGAVKAVQLGAPDIVAVGMGVMTATFGSMIRDTLLNKEPVLLGPEIYVTAALFGAAGYTLLSKFAPLAPYALPVAIGMAFALRACAIVFDLPPAEVRRRPWGGPDRPVGESCPCGSGDDYAACCGPCIGGEAVAPTAEQLMRSRYTAFARGVEPYLLRTWHSETRPSRVRLDPEQKWIGLSIKSTEAGQEGDSTGVVEFVARYKIAGKGHRLHERSRFEKIDGRWYYRDGDHL